MNISNNANVEIQVTLHINDLFKFNLSLLFRKVWYQFLFAMSIVGALTLTFPLSFTDKYIMSQSNILLTRIIVIIVVIALPISIYFKLKNGLLTDKKAVEEFNFNFSESGIECNSPSVSSNTYWNKIYKVEETKRYLWIFTLKESGFIIPKRYFKSTDQLNNLKGLLEVKLDSKILELKRSNSINCKISPYPIH
jgi:hypothetical protein